MQEGKFEVDFRSEKARTWAQGGFGKRERKASVASGPGWWSCMGISAQEAGPLLWEATRSCRHWAEVGSARWRLPCGLRGWWSCTALQGWVLGAQIPILWGHTKRVFSAQLSDQRALVSSVNYMCIFIFWKIGTRCYEIYIW